MLGGIFDKNDIQNRLDGLEKSLLKENFWKDKKLVKQTVKKKKLYEDILNSYHNSVNDLQNLKDILGDAKLKDLDWLLNFNTTYDQTNIISGFTSSGTGNVTATDEGVSTTFTTPIVTALISNTQRGFLSAANTASYSDSTKDEINKSGGNLDTTTNSNVSGYYWKDLTFSIRVYVIIRAIVNSSITADSSGNRQIIFSNDFFSTTNTPFYKLYMLMQRKAGRINTEFASAHTLTGYITPDETFPYLNASCLGSMLDPTHRAKFKDVGELHREYSDLVC